ncbi:MAG: hypothetical protein HONBIEJF_01979 [Fimbriimonadaceae bacterium]|nr:hypothetical protein [Fimbriimonadaceae bacterium]
MLATPPTLDGVINDAEWGEVPSGTHFVEEETGSAAPETTVFWLGYDASFIYFAARVTVDPKLIQATQYRVNSNLEGDDRVALGIDPTGALNEFNEFWVNPRGATQINLAGGRATKREWLGEFVAAARITETGYEVEAKIPWKVMRLPGPGKRNLRINVGQACPRTQRAYLWQFSPNNLQTIGYWDNVDVPRIVEPHTIKLLPYAYAGYDEDTGGIFNSGLDLKTKIVDRLELVGTINPDFRNIEGQILSLDFSYFERLASETRPFFLEGANAFQVGFDQRIFAPQRIRDLDAGLKIHGKLTDDLTVGLLDTIRFGEENANVGSFNYVPKGRHRFTFSWADWRKPGEDNFTTNLSTGHDIGKLSLFAGSMVSRDKVRGVGWRNNGGFELRDGTGWNVFLEWLDISPRFFPRIGFSPERDVRGFSGGVGFEKTHRGTFQSTNVFLYHADYKNHAGNVYRRSNFFEADVGFSNRLSIGYEYSRDRFFANKDEIHSIGLRYPSGSPQRQIGAGYGFGRVAGKNYKTWSVVVAYRPIPKMQVTASHQVVRHGREQQQSILSWAYDIGQYDTISGRAVRIDNDWNVYFAYRRSGVRGVEYFLILGDPNARKFRRSLILKATIPLEVRT